MTTTAHAHPRFHDRLAARLRSDPAFVFEFASRFRDVPPIDPEFVAPILTLCLPTEGKPLHFQRDIVVIGKVPDDAPALPGRAPWPRGWLVSVQILDTLPPPDALLAWPHRTASLRAQLRFPVTSCVVVPNFALAVRINEIFAIEPELAPAVIVSEALSLDLGPGAN